MKIILLSILISVYAIVTSKNNQIEDKNCISKIKDSIPELDTNSINIEVNISEHLHFIYENGFYTVKKIDSFSDFYLIFIEKNKCLNTIYSEKFILTSGKKIEVGGSYYFELFCKNKFDIGVCIHPVADITYFGKYKGFELGRLYIAKNLCGLTLIGTQ